MHLPILSIEQCISNEKSVTNPNPSHTENGPVVSNGHIDLLKSGGGGLEKIPNFWYFLFFLVTFLGHDTIPFLEILSFPITQDWPLKKSTVKFLQVL